MFLRIRIFAVKLDWNYGSYRLWAFQQKPFRVGDLYLITLPRWQRLSATCAGRRHLRKSSLPEKGNQRMVQALVAAGGCCCNIAPVPFCLFSEDIPCRFKRTLHVKIYFGELSSFITDPLKTDYRQCIERHGASNFD